MHFPIFFFFFFSLVSFSPTALSASTPLRTRAITTQQQNSLRENSDEFPQQPRPIDFIGGELCLYAIKLQLRDHDRDERYVSALSGSTYYREETLSFYLLDTRDPIGSSSAWHGWRTRIRDWPLGNAVNDVVRSERQTLPTPRAIRHQYIDASKPSYTAQAVFTISSGELKLTIERRGGQQPPQHDARTFSVSELRQTDGVSMRCFA